MNKDFTRAIFIDGANLYSITKSLGIEIDFSSLLHYFNKDGKLLRAFYYTAVMEDSEYSSVRRLIDWLDYNGYQVITKNTREYTDSHGNRKLKGNMDVEITIDALEIAPHINELILFSGDGDFRYLVEMLQKKGVRVTVVSSLKSQPSFVSDELRRQSDQFIDITSIIHHIERDKEDDELDIDDEEN